MEKKVWEEFYINIYLRLYTTIFHNSEELQLYLVRGDMFRLHEQPKHVATH